MKSAYELAMERLSRETPLKKLTPDQIAAVNEVDSLYRSKIAERETFLNSKIASAQAEGNWTEVEELKQGLARDLTTLREEAERKKDKIRET
jgi:hypothetical protein